MNNEIIITKILNMTNEGLSVELNYPSRPKTSIGLKSKTWFLSWDKIGLDMFDDYTQEYSVKDLTKLREGGGK